jgi:hypothetical protein
MRWMLSFRHSCSYCQRVGPVAGLSVPKLLILPSMLAGVLAALLLRARGVQGLGLLPQGAHTLCAILPRSCLYPLTFPPKRAEIQRSVCSIVGTLREVDLCSAKIIRPWISRYSWGVVLFFEQPPGFRTRTVVFGQTNRKGGSGV